MSEPHLTKEQQEKINKLEAELAAKRVYEETSRERRIAASKRTGIPYDIVDTDVVRLGAMIGIFRSLDKRESNEKDPEDVSILDIFLGIGMNNEEVYSYDNIPPYFMLSSVRIREEDRTEKHSAFVKNKCSSYCEFALEFLTQEYNKVESVISLSIPQLTPDIFVNAVKENMNVILEIIEEDGVDENNQHQLSVLRNSILSMIPICEYKNILIDQIKRIPCRSINNLSYIDASLTLFAGFENIQQHNVIGILRSLIVRSHTKDPKLVPFNMAAIGKECCTPAVMFIHLRELLTHTILGPYSNNPIGFMSNNFYILKCISGNVRMWIRDDGLTTFSQSLRKILLVYVTKTLNIVRTASKKPSIIEQQLVDSLNALRKPAGFRKLICSIVSTYSRIIPTEADVFDFVCENEVESQY